MTRRPALERISPNGDSGRGGAISPGQQWVAVVEMMLRHPYLLTATVFTAIVAASIGLWLRFGEALYLESILTGLAGCFGMAR